MKDDQIHVLKVEPGKAPESLEISNTLETMQKIVDGYIEVCDLDDGICLVCNEEGKLRGLEANRRIGQDIILGTFFLVGSDEEGDFCSLTAEQMEHYRQVFAEPETFTPQEIRDSFYFGLWPS